MSSSFLAAQEQVVQNRAIPGIIIALSRAQRFLQGVISLSVSEFLRSAGATSATALAALLFSLQPLPLSAQALAVQASCSGTLPNGWTFAADALDGRFLHVIWTGTQGQTRVSVLSYYATNADGFPVFRGTLQDADMIALVDTSGGSPATGTEVFVYSDDSGWVTGTCRQIGAATPEGVLSTEVILQNLIGTRDSSATNWLRRNGFTRAQVMAHSGTGKTERWRQSPSYSVDVVFAGSFVSDVLAVPQ